MAVCREPSVLGKIYIATRMKSGCVRVEVRDDGPGISEKDIRHIFEPFYTSKADRGMGVGLSICHNIIEDHGGSISACNSADGGAVFTIRLPAS
jgi:signal transduction histidine kinase